jgi:hypothetical protein
VIRAAVRFTALTVLIGAAFLAAHLAVAAIAWVVL